MMISQSGGRQEEGSDDDQDMDELCVEVNEVTRDKALEWMAEIQ